MAVSATAGAAILVSYREKARRLAKFQILRYPYVSLRKRTALLLLILSNVSVMLKSILVLMFFCAATASAQHSLETLEWLAGHWISDEGAVVQEEYWMEPAGGIMPGLHRDVRSGGTSFFEYLRIVEKDGALLYHASPGGNGETVFRADSIENGFVRFVNPAHDYPQRIVYELDLHGKLAATISDAQGGNARRWVFLKKEE